MTTTTSPVVERTLSGGVARLSIEKKKVEARNSLTNKKVTVSKTIEIKED